MEAFNLKTMETLYWITVIGKISIVAQVALFIFFVIAFITWICADINKGEDDKTSHALFKVFRGSSIVTLISLLIVIFAPSTEELYAIYGVGTVIDYTKKNKEVQKLPNNAVKALNIWLENVSKEGKDSIK